jgi:hypothetical protein
MPATVFSFGTKFYGKRDFQTDGSFVTTEWIIAGFVPLIPLHTLRVRVEGEQGLIFPIRYSSTDYRVLAKGRPQLKQVLYIYGFVLFVAAWLRLACENSWDAHLGPNSRIVIAWIMFCVPFVLPWILRFRAWRNPKPAEFPQKNAGFVCSADEA